MINIYFAINESGVNYWRGKVPFYALQKHKLANVKRFNIYDYDEASVISDMDWADVIYMPCATGMEQLVEITQHIGRGKAVVVDYDDNLFDCHPYNPAYATLGLYPVTITNSDGTVVDLWKDERHGFSLKDNRKRYYSHIDILSTVNRITTTTKTLRDNMLEYSARDASSFDINPNSINFNVFKPFDKRIRPKDKIRIGWAASDSHIVEARFIMRVMKKLRDKRSDFEFVILGNMEKFRVIAQDMPVEWHEFTALEVYPLKLASLEFDIGLIPLENHSFNISKSALKWSEYSALRIPSVMSDLAPYDCVSDGIDGLKAKDEVEFVEKIEALLDSEALRHQIANNAFERNYQDFNIDKVCYKWLDSFEKAHLIPHNVTYQGKPLKEVVDEAINLTNQPLDVKLELSLNGAK